MCVIIHPLLMLLNMKLYEAYEAKNLSRSLSAAVCLLRTAEVFIPFAPMSFFLVVLDFVNLPFQFLCESLVSTDGHWVTKTRFQLSMTMGIIYIRTKVRTNFLNWMWTHPKSVQYL